MTYRPKLLFILMSFILSCAADSVSTTPLWDEVKTESFEFVPQIENLDYDAFAISTDIDYWELRLAYPEYNGATTSTEKVEVIGKSGNKCSRADDRLQCENDFENLTAGYGGGFWNGCHPGDCFKYIASTSAQKAHAWTSRQQLLEFLGPIDTSAEAILLVHVSHFWWDSKHKEFGGIKKVSGGFEMIALQGSRTCEELERFLLRITTEGEIEILRRQIAIEHKDRHCPMT